MNKFSYIISSLLLAGSVLATSCNSSDDDAYSAEPLDYSAVQLTAFSLKSDKTVLNNLDSVYFSINLMTAEVFNANPLPYGTDISRLGVTISTSTCSAATLYVPQGAGKEDKVFNYLTEADSLIDFSHGPVRFNIVSADGTNKRDYFITVNVNTAVADSLYWAEIHKTALPSDFAAPKAQKSVKLGNSAYTLTTDGSSYCMAVSDDPYADRWNRTAVHFPRNVDVRTFTATGDALYIICDDGALLTSADGFFWSATGGNVNAIAGVFGNKLLCITSDAGGYRFVSFPGGADEGQVDESFPVAGMSNSVAFDTKWSETPQMIVSGGRLADGTVSGNTWIYDGFQWALLSSGLPAGEGYALVPYTVCETDTVTWRTRETLVTLAFGGRNGSDINRTVYLSRDMGVTWVKAGDKLQLPEYIPSTAFADVLVFNTTLTPDGASLLRAVKPITSWECPFMYMFGGVDAEGKLSTTVWRGVVNHLTSRPLQ